MEIVDKNVLYFVLGFCWPQDFPSLASSCQRINNIMKGRWFWLRLFKRFWPYHVYCYHPEEEQFMLTSDEDLRLEFIRQWTTRDYRFFVKDNKWYPLELVRSMSRVCPNLIEIQTRIENFDNWKPLTKPNIFNGFNMGRKNAISAFNTARQARRILSTTLEGDDITAFGGEIFFHRATLLKPLVSFPGKRIVYPIGTRIDLIIFKKEKWIDFCTVKHGDKVSSLMIGTEFILKGLK